MMYKNKQAMSAIVTMLIIVALALVAIGAVWYVIQGVLDEGETQVNEEQENLFKDCPVGDATDEAGTGVDEGRPCTETEVPRILRGQYCCVEP